MISARTTRDDHRSTGRNPITVSASISSWSFIEPSSAVIAEPERPAVMIAVNQNAEFAQDKMPMRSTTKNVAPNRRN